MQFITDVRVPLTCGVGVKGWRETSTGKRKGRELKKG